MIDSYLNWSFEKENETFEAIARKLELDIESKSKISEHDASNLSQLK